MSYAVQTNSHTYCAERLGLSITYAKEIWFVSFEVQMRDLFSVQYSDRMTNYCWLAHHL